MIVQLTDATEKQRVARRILEGLPDWFGVPEAVDRFVEESAEQRFFACMQDDVPVGFLALKQTGSATVEVAVMGVLSNCHRQGIGSALLDAARKSAAEAGYAFMQVKTVKMGMYPDYDRTNRFYLSQGFQEQGTEVRLPGQGPEGRQAAGLTPARPVPPCICFVNFSVSFFPDPFPGSPFILSFSCISD